MQRKNMKRAKEIEETLNDIESYQTNNTERNRIRYIQFRHSNTSSYSIENENSIFDASFVKNIKAVNSAMIDVKLKERHEELSAELKALD